MINIIKDLYILKSFCAIGNTLDKCYGCKYCRLLGDEEPLNYNTYPEDINPLFKNIPVAVNLFYGDPLLQIDNTVKILRELERRHHKGAVLIVTKGDYSKFPDEYFDLDLHFAFSTFGKDSIYDGNTMQRFHNNLSEINKRKYKYKYSIEFRPIICGVNDDYDTLKNVIKIASEFNLPVGYSGLQGKPENIKYWQKHDINFKAYEGHELGYKKYISQQIHNNIKELADKYNVNIFKKTSCLISYVHGYKRDYNAHYYRPNELGCKDCIMYGKCMQFKNQLDDNKDTIKSMIPFDFNIEFAKNHKCILYKQGICKFPSEDCANINGYLIKINDKITTSDVRMIKWLTGYTVDADFKETPYLSNNWFKTKI